MFLIISCNQNKAKVDKIELPEDSERVVMEYYNPNFELAPNSKLNTNGYYEVKKFRTFDFEEKEDYYERPDYGFVHFLSDGFCRVAYWDGMMKYSSEASHSFTTEYGRVFYGPYALESDTLSIEFLYDLASPGAGQANSRYTLKGLLKGKRIVFFEEGNGFIKSSFIYPHKNADTLTSRCVGRFVEVANSQITFDNYLKRNIGKYLEKTTN